MDTDTREKIRDEVKEILSAKEESEIKIRMENTLTEADETISSLTQTVTEREAAIVGFEGELETRDSSITSLEEKVKELEIAIESLTKEKEVVEEKASTFEADLAEIKKEQVANLRLAKIVEAKLIRETEEVKEKTKAKVKGMSDEEFGAYVEDLNEVRNSFLEELKKQEDAKDEDLEPDKDKTELELAALDIETAPPEDLVDKYKKAFKEAGFVNEE